MTWDQYEMDVAWIRRVRRLEQALGPILALSEAAGADIPDDQPLFVEGPNEAPIGTLYGRHLRVIREVMADRMRTDR